MKKIYLFSVLILSVWGLQAQNILLLETFEDTIIGTSYDGGLTSNAYVGYPSAIAGDTNWVNFDDDGLPDQSGSGRPDEWFLTFGFSNTDGGTVVAAASSWTYDPTPVANWLITPTIFISDTSAKLSWKAAPRQTPLYMDGYKVVLSTTTNDLPDFTTTLFTAAQFISTTDTNDPPTGNYALYTFSSGFVHGQDGQYVEPDTDPNADYGVLRPFEVSLAPYVGENIYIAFVHNSVDDNLISIDDIMVAEFSNPNVGIKPVDDFKARVYPNPASDYLTLSYGEKYTDVTVAIIDAKGSMVYRGAATDNMTIDVQRLPAGIYTLQLSHAHGAMTKKISIVHE